MKPSLWLLKLKEKIVLLFRKKEIKIPEKKKRIPRGCQYPNCKKKLNFITTFHCPYCDKYHCDKHRLPENHECKNPKKPFFLK